MIAQGSMRFILPPLILGLLLSFVNIWIGSILLVIGLYMLWFFRDPKRTTVIDRDLLYAAADGVIKEVLDDNHDIKIAVRMSPFDVHLNRSPYDAHVEEVIHKPGTHRNVYFGGAEEKNEQNLITLKSDDLDIEILQITGAFARRIECWVDPSDSVRQGQKIGIIRFGSQTNMLFKPRNSEKMMILPLVKVGHKVRAGITPVARIRREIDE